MNIGAPELLFILILALLIFGPKKLPEVGRTIGRGLGEFRRASNDLKRTIEREMDEAETPPVVTPTASVSRESTALPAAPAPAAVEATSETVQPPPPTSPA